MIHGPSRSVKGHEKNTPPGPVAALGSRNDFNQDGDLESVVRRIVVSFRAILFNAPLAVQTCTWRKPYCVSKRSSSDLTLSCACLPYPDPFPRRSMCLHYCMEAPTAGPSRSTRHITHARTTFGPTPDARYLRRTSGELWVSHGVKQGLHKRARLREPVVPDNSAPRAVAPRKPQVCSLFSAGGQGWLALRYLGILLRNHTCVRHEVPSPSTQAQPASRTRLLPATRLCTLLLGPQSPVSPRITTREGTRGGQGKQPSCQRRTPWIIWITSVGESRPLRAHGAPQGTRCIGSGTSFSIFVSTGTRLSRRKLNASPARLLLLSMV